MNGIERLRKLSKGMHNHGVTVWQLTDDAYAERFGVTKHGPTIKNFLSDIADQIEREHAEGCFRTGERADDVSMSAYDLLPADERETIAWVREHGGLDHVKAEWSSRVPHDLYERRRQRLLGHIAECEAALGRRNVRIEELGKIIEFFQLNNSNFRHLLADVAERLGFTRYGDDYEPEDLLDSLDRRLVPEGCEWPRYDTGEPVRIGGAIADELGHAHEVTSVEFYKGEVALHWNPDEPEECVWVGHGERVRRPTKPEPPDSWERIEEDAGKDRCSYFGAKYQDCGRCTQLATSCSISKARDLVRRCRALAERERGE